MTPCDLDYILGRSGGYYRRAYEILYVSRKIQDQISNRIRKNSTNRDIKNNVTDVRHLTIYIYGKLSQSETHRVNCYPNLQLPERPTINTFVQINPCKFGKYTKYIRELYGPDDDNAKTNTENISNTFVRTVDAFCHLGMDTRRLFGEIATTGLLTY